MNKHKIEVGSEWVDSEMPDTFMKVIYACEYGFIIEWADGSRGLRSDGEIKGQFKPKPVERVVWMNIYNGYVLTYPTKEMADSHACSSRLFCQRVVIKDT